MAGHSNDAMGKKQFPPQEQKQQLGREHKMVPRPKTTSPEYRGSGKLAAKAALITGGDSGIGRAVAVLFAKEGADVALIYFDEHTDANETTRLVEAEGKKCANLSYMSGRVLHPNGGEVING